MGDIAVNKIYFLNNKNGIMPKDKLLACLAGFYEKSKVLAANSALFEAAKRCLMDDTLRRAITRKGGNKVKANCDDMISLYSLMNKEKVPLLKFYSENMKHVPAFR